jgi:hypothetical protein
MPKVKQEARNEKIIVIIYAIFIMLGNGVARQGRRFVDELSSPA